MNKDLILAKLQENEWITIKELAHNFNVGYGTMQKFLKEVNIITKSKSERLSQRNKIKCTHQPIKISNNANQIIMGSLLGDGSIIKKRTNCIFVNQHSKIQSNYVKHLYNLCIINSLEVKIRTHKGYENSIDGRVIKNNGRIGIFSKVNQTFNDYRNTWYPKNIKIIPDTIFELKPLGLAIWFMDDGSYHKGTKNYYLSTDGFEYNDIIKLTLVLKKNFNLETSIHKRKKSYVIYIKAKSRNHFVKLITPYICESMNYKIIGQVKHRELLGS